MDVFLLPPSISSVKTIGFSFKLPPCWVFINVCHGETKVLADFPPLKNICHRSHCLVGFLGVKTFQPLSAKCHINSEYMYHRKIC